MDMFSSFFFGFNVKIYTKELLQPKLQTTKQTPNNTRTYGHEITRDKRYKRSKLEEAKGSAGPEKGRTVVDSSKTDQLPSGDLRPMMGWK